MPKVKDPKAPNGAKRSPQWPAVRRAFLKDKVCAVCGGTLKLEAHHLKPFHLHPELELRTANLIPLCEKPGHDCHFVFGHCWDWSQFNPAVRKDAAAFRQRAKKAKKALALLKKN